ncbi:hypothetical protein AB0C91_10140 [Streptomyces sp. NPDC048674]|uniref:hypothetical protein n=1 Tax=Streptomyces sp. NPDC048674 TaxID=3155491 RepID=UPI003428A254
MTVSTMQLAPNYYDTVIFDDTPDGHHNGWLLGGYVIDASNKRAATREEAMDQHREAVQVARTETPKAPTQ